MKRKNCGYFLLALVILVLFSRDTPARQTEKSLLWKIEGKAIKTSYLFGTFHMLPKSDFEIKEKVRDAFNLCEQLVLELKMDNPLMQLELLNYVAMKDSMTIDQLVDSADYLRLDQALRESVGIGIAMFNSYKPMLIGALLIMKYIEGEPASFDLTLTEMAKERGIPIAGLETVKYQVSIFDEIPYEDQIKDVMKMINEEERMTEMFSEMVSTYRNEDLNALFDLTRQDAVSEKEIELMLLKRNRDWIPKIEILSKDKPTFYGVGAAHLGGEEGLIFLLRKAGYKVSPVL
ncbi:MAG: TraB/GumN family protein [Bacteroidales bacterium]|nr:TraB/GumN family protein [Bacteroidales bacterium]MBN2697639.1 TraB/GumN family protein [Bacteroidales bacterium]